MSEEIWFKIKFYLMKLSYFQKRSRLKRFGLPIILIAVIFPPVIFFQSFLFQFINNQALSFLVFILIVTVSSWYGGLGPGIFATVLVGLVNFFTFLAEDIPYHPVTADLFLTLVYLLIGLIISIISEARYESELQKDEFIGLATHELKNPLSAVIGFAGLLRLAAAKSGNQTIERISEDIESQSYRMLELINDLLDVNRISVGKFVYKKELFSFDDLVKEAVNQQKVINKNRSVVLSGSSGKIIEADRYRIGQVITNLLTNALKYSPAKNPVKIKIAKNKKGVTLAVKDFGVGITKLEQKKVFNKYYRTKSSLGQKEGLGLGLYICRSIVNHHKGKMWIKSAEGKGSTFFLSLPLYSITTRSFEV